MGRTWSIEDASPRSDREIAGLGRHRAGPGRAGEQPDGRPGSAPREQPLVALRLEVDRARRTGNTLVVGCVVINYLTHPNGPPGHLDVPGIVESKVRSSLRSYDVVVRRNDHELIYSLECADVDLAARRFETIRASIEPITGAWLTAGFSLLREDDTLAEVIARAAADAAADQAPASVRSRVS